MGAILQTGPVPPPTNDAGRIGGAELQQAIVGRELARRGHRVTFLVADPGGLDSPDPVPETLGGIRVIAYAGPRAPETGASTAPDSGKGWRIAREAALLLRAILRAEADVYSVRSNHLCAVTVAGICRMLRKPFVFAAGHDGNCDPERAHHPLNPMVAVSYAAALRGASAVVAQGETQRDLIERNFGAKARVIPSAIRPMDPPAPGPREGVLWVGSIEPRKGPDRALEVASALPGVRFTMVGGGVRGGWHDEVAARASALPNVSWLGPQAHHGTLGLFDRAALYLNTSRSEGFPNTFLEAWMRGAPVVSMDIDPDGCLARHGMGLTTGGVGETAQGILDLIGDPRRRDAMARAARFFAESRHGIDSVADAWEDLLADAALAGGSRGAAVASAGCR
jgi:glycosyltransferase involved in cell wall biosynthesis